MNQKITFTGSFLEYFISSLGLMLLSILTFGLAFPYWSYWSFKYFFTKMTIDGKRVIYNGSFMEYFIMSLGLMLLSVITFGLAFPYWIYWSVKYFFTKMEISQNQYYKQEIPLDKPIQKIPQVKSNTDNLFD